MWRGSLLSREGERTGYLQSEEGMKGGICGGREGAWEGYLETEEGMREISKKWCQGVEGGFSE